MNRILTLIFLLVLCFSIVDYASHSRSNSLVQPTKPSITQNLNYTPSSSFVSSKLQGTTINEITSAGLSFPLEGELNSYNRLQTTQMLINHNATITDIEQDGSGNVYVLGNYNTSAFNFTLTGLNTLGNSVTFTTGTPSNQSSFVLAYNSTGSFLYGKEIDFDDNFDYYMVSMQPDGANFVFLAEKRPVLNYTPTSDVDIEVFKFTSNFSAYSYNTYGDVARNSLGIPSDFSYGIANIPAHLLKVDSLGNIYVAGMSKAVAFPNSNNNYLNPYSHTYSFSATNLADPSYTNLSFTGSRKPPP